MTKDEFKNLDIGETFQLGYHKLRVEETSSSCKNCYMNEIGSCDKFYDYGLIPECIDRDRKDEKAVIFREIEK